MSKVWEKNCFPRDNYLLHLPDIRSGTGYQNCQIFGRSDNQCNPLGSGGEEGGREEAEGGAGAEEDPGRPQQTDFHAVQGNLTLDTLPKLGHLQNKKCSASVLKSFFLQEVIDLICFICQNFHFKDVKNTK